MKSINNLQKEPAGTPLLADDVLEFHAARLLLLFSICGTAGKIEGLTKMAKLDFFVRYPQFFNIMCEHLGKSLDSSYKTVESSMVRFHYGPWDKRYYHILSYLEGKELITISRKGNQYQFELTDLGRSKAALLKDAESFKELTEHMKGVKKEFGGKKGETLKKLIYQVFGQEVADRAMGEIIK
jgi:DNA-binding PadR family transcriptional regulator